jgi:hypothetical protein
MARKVANLVQAAIARRGALITLRSITPAPAGPIPPIFTAPVLTADAPVGSTTLSIDCGTATGVLSVGDTITVAGQTVTVQTAARARAIAVGVTPGFDNVPFTPALTSDAPAASAVTFTWAADQQLRAIVEVYPERMVDGDNIMARDLRIRIAARATTQPNPATQKLVINGDERTIVNANPVFAAAAELVEWMLQAR